MLKPQLNLSTHEVDVLLGIKDRLLKFVGAMSTYDIDDFEALYNAKQSIKAIDGIISADVDATAEMEEEKELNTNLTETTGAEA
jgi:hypothetical protein